MAKEKEKLNEVKTALEEKKDEIAKMKSAKDERKRGSKSMAIECTTDVGYVEKTIKKEIKEKN